MARYTVPRSVVGHDETNTYFNDTILYISKDGAIEDNHGNDDISPG